VLPLPTGYNCPDIRYVTRYGAELIQTIRHKGLKRFHEEDDASGVMHEHVVKLRDILARLDAARTVADMDLPGFRLHPLKGDLKGLWAVTVRANWRVVFRFVDRDALDVDYVDYH
jgi:proteic killer suppression protein